MSSGFRLDPFLIVILLVIIISGMGSPRGSKIRIRIRIRIKIKIKIGKTEEGRGRWEDEPQGSFVLIFRRWKGCARFRTIRTQQRVQT